MEFLKTNLAKMLVAIVALVGAVLLIIPAFMASSATFVSASQTIGIVLFFIGIATCVCLKMCDKAKAYAKHVALASSILVLVFMSIGLLGFNKDREEAEGVFGNAYAIYRGFETTANEGLVSLSGLRSGLDAIPAPGGTPLAGLVPDLTDTTNPLLPLVMALTSPTFGLEMSATVDQAKAVVDIAIQAAENGATDANAAALTILFSYIALMLALGLIPAIFATKKVACKKES